MKYLYTRDIFLENFRFKIDNIEEINEVVTNEITFGGSLLGRFINSTIRKAKIGYNYSRVESIVKAIENELNNIIFDGLSDDEKREIKILLVQYYLSEIKKVCDDTNLKESEKIKQLIGNNGETGLTKGAIDWSNTLDEGQEIFGITKETLIENLENFKKEIKNIKDNFDKKDELIKNIEKLLETTEKLHTEFTGLTASVISGSASVTVNPTSLNFGAVITGSQSVQTIHLTANNLKNKEIKISGSNVFQISFDNVIYSNVYKIKPTSSSFSTSIYVKFIAAQISKINTAQKENINIYGNDVDLDIPVEGVRKPSQKVPNPKPTPKNPNNPITAISMIGNNSGLQLLQSKPIFIKIKNKSGQIIPVEIRKIEKIFRRGETDPKNNGRRLSNPIFQILTKKGTTRYVEEIYENIDTSSLDKIYENFILNSYLFESIVDPADIVNANTEHEAILKKLNIKNLINYLRKNKKDNADKDFLEFSEKFKDSSFNLNANNSGIGIPETESIIAIMDELYSKLDEHDSYFWNEDGIKEKENLEEWLKLAKTVKESDYYNNKNSLKVFEDSFGNNFNPQTATTEKQKKELEEKIENSKTTINFVNESGQNRLLKIVDLFGKAYSCFAIDYIPSGRPNGRISTKTRNEYFYIGSSTVPTMTVESGPGFGPWVNKLIFRKFGEKITELISFEKYIKILGPSTIETKDGKKEGNVLLQFMRDMIDQNDLKNFDQKRSDFLTKYFGIKAKVKPADRTGNEIEDRENEDQIKWIVEPFKTETLKEGMFIAFCCKPAKNNTTFEATAKKIVGYVAKIEKENVLIKFQIGSLAIIKAYSEYKSLPAQANLGLKFDSKKNTFVGAFKMPLENGKKINLTVANINSLANTNTFSIEIEGGSFSGGSTRQFPPGILNAKGEALINENLTKKSLDITNDVELNINGAYNALTSNQKFGKDVVVGAYLINNNFI
jgi:hypothetical protein